MNDYSNANASADIVYVPRDEWEAQGKRIAELEAEATEYLAANKKAERIIAELDADMKENDSLRKRMATILNETANALHGGELENGLWSWHDLAERAQTLMRERDAALIGQSQANEGYEYERQARILAMQQRDAALEDAQNLRDAMRQILTRR